MSKPKPHSPDSALADAALGKAKAAALAVPMLEKLCADCPAKAGEDWRKRAQLIRREFRRNHLVERERLIAEVILDLTLGKCRESIAIPVRTLFTDLTGIVENHVSEVLTELHGMRIIRVVTVKGQPTYSIREDPDPDGISPFAWKVRPRISVAAMQRSLESIFEINGMSPNGSALEAIANFKVGPGAKKINPDSPKTGCPVGRPETNPLPAMSEYLPHLF